MYKLSDTVNRKFIDIVDINDLEIETDTGWEAVTKISQTEKYQQWIIKTESGKCLECADTHIVFDHNINEVFVKDLKENQSIIQTVHGSELVVSVTKTDQFEHMYDIAVNSNNHRYFTNGILSHNTAFLNGLSYALYGAALSNIKKDNLINRTNTKGMLVTVEFEKDGVEYRIERGRKPNITRFWVGTAEQEVTNDSQGDSRETQQAIERILGMSHDMFKHIVALNTYTDPFLNMKSNDQRAIIEQLLGITLLSEKADKLKEGIKETKEAITADEYRIKAIIEANTKIQEQIEALKRRQSLWLKKHHDDTTDLSSRLASLLKVDIDVEIQRHKDGVTYRQKKKDIDELDAAILRETTALDKEKKALVKLEKEVELLNDHKCHSCGQELHDSTHTGMLKAKLVAVTESKEDISTHESTIAALKEAKEKLGPLGKQTSTYYRLEEEAIHHRSTVENLQSQIQKKNDEIDPYAEQIDDMTHTALAVVDYANINVLTQLKDHQEFLYKLLTNKDSFIRKRIIDQNLTYLNSRLDQYLSQIGLPHTVRFQNDLTVLITEYGRDMDFDSLSRGERNRLIISLSLAFRDVFESLYTPINLLFVDELIDNGLDSKGVDDALAILKKMTREQNKSVWLVSHRDELASRVTSVLKVIKSNGFTEYAEEIEQM
jgi:DNA repair exonuclease SbcCD ATPase subunit